MQHTRQPNRRAGAEQAIGDAHVFAELLGDLRVTEPADVAAFRRYDAVRRPRSQRVATNSKENAYLLCLCLEGADDNEGRLKKAFQERLRWLWDVDVQGPADKSVSCNDGI